jgi:Thioredoxin
MGLWSEIFAEALPYSAFLDRYATRIQRARWDEMHSRFVLSNAQHALLSSFTRDMPVLCLAGAWCGDCINQCPIFAHFAQASEQIDLRFLDRDARSDVRELLTINGGQRVPMVVFLSEDWLEIARYGERTLSSYRRLAADQLGLSCPTGLALSSAEVNSVVAMEWLAEFERAQLILRLSPRLREKHRD